MIPPLPDDLPIIERDAVRIVVQDVAGDVLLFHTREFGAPELGEWWELPGGGVDEGESYLTAAVRELREETGIVISEGQVGPPTWRRTASFRHRDRRHLQHEVVVLVRLDRPAPQLDTTGQLDYELEDYTAHRWWAVPDVVTSRERFYPGRLPEYLPMLLAGVEVEEPFELFS